MMRRSAYLGLTVTVIMLCAASILWASNYYVDGTIGDDGNDGSREFPWRTICHALSQVGGSEASAASILVASGTYSESSNGERFPLILKSYVSLSGTGPESTILDAGGRAAHVIFLQNVTAATIEGMTLTGGAAGGAWPDDCGGGVCCISSHVSVSNCKIVSNTAQGTELLGAGAGIYIYGDCSPRIANSTIAENTSSGPGGGVCSQWGASPKFEDCEVWGNTSGGIFCRRWSSLSLTGCSVVANQGGGIICEDFSTASLVDCNIATNSSDFGGGMVCRNHSSALVSRCTFWNNQASENGGALLCQRSSTCQLTDCEVSSNQASEAGGGIYCTGSELAVLRSSFSANQAATEGGGVVCALDCQATIKSSTFTGNLAAHGGGAAFCDNAYALVESCTFKQNTAEQGGAVLCQEDSSPLLIHCTMVSNQAKAQGLGIGGALLCQYYSSPLLGNCLLVSNQSDQLGGGIFSQHYSDPWLFNCTVWDNEAPSGASIVCQQNCLAAVTNSIVSGQHGEIIASGSTIDATYSCIPGGFVGQGNIDADPLFAHGPSGDYYLGRIATGQSQDSPCIDAGVGTAESLGLDSRTTSTDDTPDAGIADMGYHYPYSLPRIECWLDDTEFSVGDQLRLWVRLENPGDSTTVDAYVAFLLPDGATVSVTQSGLQTGMLPYYEGLPVPAHCIYGPLSIFETTVPGSCPPGNYIAVAALCAAGSKEYLGRPSLFGFAILK